MTSNALKTSAFKPAMDPVTGMIQVRRGARFRKLLEDADTAAFNANIVPLLDAALKEARECGLITSAEMFSSAGPNIVNSRFFHEWANDYTKPNESIVYSDRRYFLVNALNAAFIGDGPDTVRSGIADRIAVVNQNILDGIKLVSVVADGAEKIDELQSALKRAPLMSHIFGAAQKRTEADIAAVRQETKEKTGLEGVALQAAFNNPRTLATQIPEAHLRETPQGRALARRLLI